jgi:hypothetical protein
MAATRCKSIALLDPATRAQLFGLSSGHLWQLFFRDFSEKRSAAGPQPWTLEIRKRSPRPGLIFCAVLRNPLMTQSGHGRAFHAATHHGWTLVHFNSQLDYVLLSLVLRRFRESSHMDFIERYLGFSPDHGDGSFEAMLLIALVVIITGLALGYFHKAKHDVRKQTNLN